MPGSRVLRPGSPLCVCALKPVCGPRPFSPPRCAFASTAEAFPGSLPEYPRESAHLWLVQFYIPRNSADASEAAPGGPRLVCKQPCNAEMRLSEEKPGSSDLEHEINITFALLCCPNVSAGLCRRVPWLQGCHCSPAGAPACGPAAPGWYPHPIPGHPAVIPRLLGYRRGHRAPSRSFSGVFLTWEELRSLPLRMHLLHVT